MPTRIIKIRRTTPYRKYTKKNGKDIVMSESRVVAVPRNIPLGFPATKLVKLKYTAFITIDSGTTIASHAFRANDMFDPDFTGAGHQPLYFDQYMAAYDHFCVLGSRIKVTFMNVVTTPLIPGMFGVFLDNNSTFSYTGADQVVEGGQRYSHDWKVTSGTGQFNTPKSCTLNFSAKRFFGVQKIVGQDSYQGSKVAVPTEPAFFQIWVGAISANNPTAVILLVEIEYIAMLTEKAFTTQSTA